MKTYAVTYINKEDRTVTENLSVVNMFHLTVKIYFDLLKDVKDNNPDNIIAYERV